ncbi:unnamed protein product [Cylindrotheca closterium]|uniref:Protein kinase domain-containing protein n=1 Tax=Cylindrotheca closterium TaxID=2856 RepID=A0AAD2FAN8_9STRA|nr:unnamed protein product [Cylindrotheca closterium]
MGGGQSHDNWEDDDNGVCKPCFLFKAPMSRSKRSDPMGTPMPETPIVDRRKRDAAAAKIQESKKTDPVFSSQYFGIEKEVDPKNPKNSAKNNPSGRAIVHEGQDAEQQMQAKYQMMEVLGVGSTSTCHRCVDKRSNLHYACKIIDKKVIEDRFQGMMDQFHTEIDALRSLDHPAIIQLLDVYITQQKIFIIMELMEGGELFDYVVQKGTLTEDEASSIVRKVTGALVYMHEKNIVHRDLKPENLLLRRIPRNAGDSVEVKIIDFGLSKLMQEPVARSFLGTRGYLAPEMLQRRDYTKAVDTWALGVIVFVLLCGCLPFDDDSQTVPSDDLVRTKFVLRFPRWAKNLSASAKDLLSKLLNVNPGERYSAEQALAHPWVTGKAAPKGNLLASPGRIRASPNVRAKQNRSTPNRNGRHGATGSGKYIPPNRSPAAGGATTKRVMVRKTSI